MISNSLMRIISFQFITISYRINYRDIYEIINLIRSQHSNYDYRIISELVRINLIFFNPLDFFKVIQCHMDIKIYCYIILN